MSVVSFLCGRAIAESERILVDKRRVYEHFLSNCPVPNDLFSDEPSDAPTDSNSRMLSAFPVLLLYAAPNVVLAAQLYLDKLVAASNAIAPHSEALHPAFREAAKAHNDLILEMRRDAFAWSAFGHRQPSRLPKLYD